MKKCLIQLGCHEEKITVQHLGVDVDQIKFIPREPHGQGEIRVLMAGSFKEKKGIPFGVEAFSRVRKTHKNVSLTIIGDSTGTLREENEKRKILRTIEKHRLNHFVKLMGYQPYPVFLDIARNHHIFLSPSIHASDGDIEGGAPVSIIEMSASGMPILSTTHCDIPEVVVDGESGLLVPEKDVTALTEQLEFLVSNPHKWKTMGTIGRKHIENNYNVKTQIKKLEDIYDSLR